MITKTSFKCPGHYGSYDQRIDDCPICEQGRLYQICQFVPPVPKTIGRRKIPIINSHPACAGWSYKTNKPMCCKHHIMQSFFDFMTKVCSSSMI